MTQLSRRAALASAFALGGAAALSRSALAQVAAANEAGVSAAAAVDALARAVMAANPDQPGLGLALVENGRVTLTRGYGVRRMGEASPVTEQTLFGVASNTKAMTAAALAMLVEEGKVAWDAPVTRYLPDFAMSDPDVTRLMTVRDLLVHRSGLTLGAGDLMIWPQPTHTRAEIVAGLRHLPLTGGGFRSGYAYDNVLYVVAGEVIRAASGLPWEAFVQTRLLDPLGMADSTPAPRRADEGRRAAPHARLGPPVRGLGPMRPLPYDSSFDAAAPAGGVNASARDMAKWMQVQLAKGALPNGRRLWSEASANEMWKPQTLTSSTDGATADDPARPVLQAYALGWFVRDFRGERMLTHTGGLAGFISVTALLPGRRSGIMVMTNAEEGPVLRAMRHGGADRLAGRTDHDWIASSRRVQATADANTRRDAAAALIPASGGSRPSLPLTAYAGAYRDPWYGTVTVSRRGEGLHLSMDRTPLLRGRLEPFDGETFRTVFDDRTQEDAFVTFELEGGRPVRATMRAVSPLADFSYDFQDLQLTRQ